MSSIGFGFNFSVGVGSEGNREAKAALNTDGAESLVVNGSCSCNIADSSTVISSIRIGSQSR